MERDDQTIKGWRKYKHAFTFGAAAKAVIQEPDDNQTPDTCSLEPIGEGCYRSFSDVDMLDQQ